MIVVTGATGKLGRAIVEALLDRVPADRIGASARDPSKIADLARRGAACACAGPTSPMGTVCGPPSREPNRS